MNGVLIRRGHWDTEKERKTHTRHAHTQLTLWGHSKKVSVCRPRREASKAKPANTLSLNFQPPEPWENKYLLKLP